ADMGCTVPGIKSPSQSQCAEYSIQQIMRQLQPSQTSVALMSFPGTGTQFVPSKPCPAQPDTVPYLSSNIHYQIGSGFYTDYNDGSGVLNDSSQIVQAVGDTATSLVGCQQPVIWGGQGTYLAEVITKAQAALPIVAGTKNVVILLSDGDSNAS